MSIHPAVHPAASPASAEPPASLRLPATLLLSGQLLYIVVTLLHTGGEANDHHDVFAEYADSGSWTVVHLGQFASMAILVAGLIALFSALHGPARATARLGAAAATATLALYGALQAVDGVALKQAVMAWASAPEADKAARFAAAEAVRWLEWGLRSYQDIALGLALLLFAAAVARTARIPRPIAALMALAGSATWCRAGSSARWASRTPSRWPSWRPTPSTWPG
jgi:hypothetical protein